MNVIIHVYLAMHKFSASLFVLLLGIFVCPFVYGQYTDVINSNRPSMSMGAFSVGKNVFQWEQGFSFRHGSFSTFYDASFSGFGTNGQLRVGLFKEQLEFVGTIDYQMDKLQFEYALGPAYIQRRGIKDASAGIKYLVFDPFRNVEKYKPNLYSYHANRRIRWRDLLPAVSIYAGAQFGVGGIYPYQETFFPLFDLKYRPIVEPAVSGTGMLILQQHLRPGLVLVHNIGMRYITADFSQKKIIGTLTYSSRKKWSVFGEYQMDDSPLFRDVTLGGGVAYLFSDDFQLDIAAQQSLKTTPKLVTAGLGFSYRLDRHNIWDGEPQSIKEMRSARLNRKNERNATKGVRKAERRTAKGLRKLDKKQKKIDRKLKKLR